MQFIKSLNNTCTKTIWVILDLFNTCCFMCLYFEFDCYIVSDCISESQISEAKKIRKD